MSFFDSQSPIVPANIVMIFGALLVVGGFVLPLAPDEHMFALAGVGGY